MVKRHVAIFRAALLAWTFFCARGHASVVLSENFDTTAIGTVPSGWTVTAPAGTAVAVSNNLSFSSPNSLRFDKTTGTGGDFPQALLNFSAVSGKALRVSYRVRTSTSNHDSMYVKLRNAAAQEVGGLRLSTGSKFQFQMRSGAWADTGSNYAANVWYNLQIEFDLTNFTYNAWLNNTMLVIDAPFRTNTSTAASIIFQDRVVAGSGQSYVDDLKIEWVDKTPLNAITDQYFDSTADGDIPSGWTRIETNSAANVTSVGVASEQSVSSPKSLKLATTLQDGASSAASAIYTFGSTYSGGVIVVSYQGRTSTTNHDSLYAKLRWGMGGNEIGGIRMNQTGVFAYQQPDATWQVTTNTYASNTWYSIVLAFDLDNGIFNAWANGAPIVFGAGFRTGSQRLGHSFIFQDRAFLGTGTSYIDNVRITRITGPVDIGAGIAASTNYAEAGQPIVYTIVVTNHSTTLSGTYDVNVLLPSSLNILTGTTAGAQIAPGSVSWQLTQLPAGAITTLTLIATPTYTGNTNPVSVVATVSVSHALGDWTSGNDSGSSGSVTILGIPLLGTLGLLVIGLVIAWIFLRQARQAQGASPSPV